MQSLIRLYFAHQNILFPLLHRPTLEKCVADGLHLSNELFAEKILLVCAIGSRYSDDPRVLLDDRPAHLSRGWKWFSQVQVSRDLLLRIPTTDGMQFCCVSIYCIICKHVSLTIFQLLAMYLHGTSIPQASWRFAGFGIHIAKDMGAHRRKAHNFVPSVEDELMKRAFWCAGSSTSRRRLRLTAYLLGHSCCWTDYLVSASAVPAQYRTKSSFRICSFNQPLSG